MHKLKSYMKNKKYIFLFLGILFLIGIITGMILGITNIESLKEDVFYYASNIGNNSYNYLLIHFFLLILSLVTSFIGFGIPILCTILFYEGLTFGFLLGIFSFTYQIGGFLFASIYFLLTKGFYVLFLSFFFFKCLEIARKMIGKFIYKTDPSTMIVKYLIACGVLIVLTFLFDGVVFFLARKILPLFHFLIS